MNSKITDWWSSNRGQINLVFTFVIAIMIVGLIVVIASKAMNGLFEDKCNTDLISFRDDIISEIAANNDYGSINELRIKTPCDYTQLCLVDAAVMSNYDQAKEIGRAIVGMDNSPGAFVVGNMVGDQVKSNVFLISQNGKYAIESGYAPQLVLGPVDASVLNFKNDVLCINSSSGYFRIKSEGLGRYTLLSKPSN